MTKKKITCPTCHKKTRYLFKMNDGIFCDHDWEAKLVEQNMNLFLENLKQKINASIFFDSKGDSKR